MRALLKLLAFAVLVLVLSPLWLPLAGLALVDVEAVETADAILVVHGAGPTAVERAEDARRAGTARWVVIVEGPVRTHAWTTYWTELVRLGLAQPAPTPPELLRIVRADSEQPAAQARAALPALQELGVRSVLVPAGGLSSRLVGRDVRAVLGPAGIGVRVVQYAPPEREPGRWFFNADDRRYVLSSWLQLVVPGLSGEEPQLSGVR